MPEPVVEHHAIGIDLGGTNIKGVLIDTNGTVLEKIERETKDNTDNSGKIWKLAIHDMVVELQNRAEFKISAIGLAAPGISDKKNERILSMPGRLQGLENFRWADFIKAGQIPVKVINDAQAALIAEGRYGSGKGYKHIVMLTLGTGVGGGILIDGNLYQGHFQRAGHVGHISLDSDGPIGITGIPGSLEEAIGNSSLSRRSSGRFESTFDLLQASKKGDIHATQVWLESVRNLSIGICSLINAFAPEIVILGGGIVKAGDSLFKPLDHFMEIFEWRPGGVQTPMKQASFIELSGAIGAAGFGLSSLNK